MLLRRIFSNVQKQLYPDIDENSPLFLGIDQFSLKVIWPNGPSLEETVNSNGLMYSCSATVQI